MISAEQARCIGLVNRVVDAGRALEAAKALAEQIAHHTGQPVERIEADSDRDRWFTALEAKEYGFIDAVIERSTSRAGS
jgi:ATP-dependent Clp protease protease subunit